MKKILTLISVAILIVSTTVSAHNEFPQDRFKELLKLNLAKPREYRVGDSWTTTTVYTGDCPYKEITENQVIKTVYRGVYILEKTTGVGAEVCTGGKWPNQIVYRDTNDLMDFLSGEYETKVDYAITELGNNKFLFTSSFFESVLDISVPFYRIRIKQTRSDFYESTESHGVKPVDLKNEDIEICSLVPNGGMFDGYSYLCAVKNPYDFLDLI